MSQDTVEGQLTDIVTESFAHVSEAVLNKFVPLVVQSIVQHEQEALESGDLERVQRIINEFQSPSGEHGRKGVIQMHWPPLPTPPPSPAGTPELEFEMEAVSQPEPVQEQGP